MRLATDEPSLTLVVSRRLAASPDRVFDAWFDPNAVGAWLFATPGGISKHVEIDARVGQRFFIELNFDLMEILEIFDGMKQRRLLKLHVARLLQRGINFLLVLAQRGQELDL